MSCLPNPGGGLHIQSTPALGQRHRRTKRLPIFGPVFAQTHRQAQHKTPPPQLVKFHLMRSGRPGPGDCRICRIDWGVLPMKYLPPPPGLLRAPPPLTTDPTHVVVLFFRESFVMNKAHHCTAPAQDQHLLLAISAFCSGGGLADEKSGIEEMGITKSCQIFPCHFVDTAEFFHVAVGKILCSGL